jgi:hypothetical protein
MTTQQLESFIEEMEERAKEFDDNVIRHSQVELNTTAEYYLGAAIEARYVAERLKEMIK